MGETEGKSKKDGESHRMANAGTSRARPAAAQTQASRTKVKVFQAPILDKGIKRPLRAVTPPAAQPKVSSQNVGKTIRLLRIAANWSQAELARRSDLPQATVSLIESGKSLTMENLTAIASSLDMSVSRLIKAAERREAAYGTNKDLLELADTLVDSGWDPGKLNDLLAKRQQ